MARRDPGEPFYRISVAEASDMYGQNDVAFIDVRRPDEYAEGHVKGAVPIPVDDVLARVDEIPSDKKLLFICAQGVRFVLAQQLAHIDYLDDAVETCSTEIERRMAPYCEAAERLDTIPGVNRGVAEVLVAEISGWT